MTAFEFHSPGKSELTTREMVANGVAHGWLASHPEVEVTTVDLAKTMQQLMTELFRTGGRQQREALSPHAVAVLGEIGVLPEEFAPVRSFAKTADIPVEYGAMLGRLADVLAPLSAAVQLARIPVTNAAAKLLGADESIDRRQLRGFVVGHVRPHAQRVHARVGVGESVDVYLRLILADIEVLAMAVVESARAKYARPDRLEDVAAERAADFTREHLEALMRYAASRFGEEADDVVGSAMLKIVAQFRNNPALRIGRAYGRAAVDSAAKDLFAARQKRLTREAYDSEVLELVAGTSDDVATVDDTDVAVRMVLSAAAQLVDPVSSEGSVAREALLRYFLVDPREIDPRRARLAEHALGLVAGNGGDGIGAELGAFVAMLGSAGAAVERVTELAISALRTQVEVSRG